MYETDHATFWNHVNSDIPFFINRLGGSDFKTWENYMGKCISPEEAIRTLSLWNGYYDTSHNDSSRRNNLQLFFDQLLSVYKNNAIQLNACNFVKYHSSFADSVNSVSYVCYHHTCEGPNFFRTLLTNKLVHKRVLVISAFTEQIKEQERYLAQLYGIPIHTEFVYINTQITYLNEDTDKYMNTPHSNFHESVEHYKKLIDETAFDFALLSCGSYAHFLGEHIKNINKQSIYIGGILQLYFGIFGDLYLTPSAKWFDLNYCALNTFRIPHSPKTLESCNSYLYNEYKYEERLRSFHYERDSGLNFTAAKILHLINR